MWMTLGVIQSVVVQMLGGRIRPRIKHASNIHPSGEGLAIFIRFQDYNVWSYTSTLTFSRLGS
jgi:hypothetical protein